MTSPDTSRTLFTLITTPTLPADFSDALDAAILAERCAERDPGFDHTAPREEVTSVSGMTAGQEQAFELYLRRPSVRRRQHPPTATAA